jgi:hypothetical protein
MTEAMVRLLVVLLAVMCGCAGPAPDGTTGKARTEYYLDANLRFVIEHPQGWQRQPTLEKGSNRVVWLAPITGDVVGLTVISMAPALVTGGFDSLLTRFAQDHPEFTPRGIEKLDLPGAPARQALGSTPDSTWLVVLITSSQRAFILQFIAPQDRFEAWRPVFDEMLESFRVME